MANNQESKLTKDEKYNFVFEDADVFEAFPGAASIKELFEKVESIVDKINAIDEEQYVKTGITTSQANAITANTAKVGITSTQANAITANTAKTGITTAQATSIAALDIGRIASVPTSASGVTAQIRHTITYNQKTGAATLNKIFIMSDGARYSSTETLTKISK